MGKRDSRAKVMEMFDGLVKNALDFLETSIREIEKNPKYSVIHFCSGVEIFLKARLLLEHWSLIITDEKGPNLDRFIGGHARTVTIDQAIKLLQDAVKTEIPAEAQRCFKAISNHRNRLTHFFHEQDNDTVEKIAGEQCVSWYYLHQLLTESWLESFRRFSTEIDKINTLMLGNRQFLEKKFTLLSQEIQNQTLQGTKFFHCKFCQFEAAKGIDTNTIFDDIEIICLVCNARSEAYRLTCPQCNTHNFLYLDEKIGGIDIECWNCGYTFDLTNDLESASPAYCLSCEYEAQPTVFYINGNFICVKCLAEHDEVVHCEWCNEPFGGHIGSDTYIFGCQFCEGSIGYQMSKND